MLHTSSARLPVARLPAQRTLLWTALAAALVSPRMAAAQIDTPAASEARSALRAVEQAYGDRIEWNQWSRILNLPDVVYELHAGDRTRAAPLRTAVMQLLGGRVSEFAEPAFARLAKALDVRAQELKVIPSANWPSACRAQVEIYAPVTPEAIQQARVEFERRLDRFEQWLPSVSQPNDAWAAFLFWPETRSLATPSRPGPAPTAELLDRLELRWSAAPAVWDDDLLFDTSLAARTYIRRLRSYLKGETRQQHAAAWNELADLLTGVGPGQYGTATIAAAVIEREKLGQSSRLTASIRLGLSRPNLVVQMKKEWLESQLARRIDEPYDVDGVFAGSRSVGRGRMVGNMYGQVLPSAAVGQFLLRMKGTSTGRATGWGDRVTVVSRATTRVSGTKPFLLDTRGLTPQRALAGAVTAIEYESINASGLPRRRSIAVSETYARRPQAEAESAAYARRSILEQINSAAAELADEFNRSYYARLRDPRINAIRPAPVVRVLADEGQMRWECLLEGAATFGAPVAPPEFDAGTEVVMSLAASAMEEQAAVSLGGRQMSGEQLQESLGPALGEAAERPSDDFTVTFDGDPCDIHFDDGAIQARLYVTKFDSADVKYPAMTVDVVYKPEERDGNVVFVRQGRVRVAPIAREDGKPPVISGRQQTLRLAVQRKLARVLTEELVFSSVSLPLAEDEKTNLRIERAQLVAPWLQIGLAPETES